MPSTVQLKASRSNIVHGFQAFYYELLKQKEVCLSTFFAEENKSSDPDIGEHDTEEDNKLSKLDTVIVNVQQKLITTINEICENIDRKSKIDAKQLDNVKYMMAILADEIFITIKWDGAKLWRFSLLEKQLFNTEIAGERFYTMLDSFISDATIFNEEIGFVYLMLLSLGFQGKYMGSKNADKYISGYKNKLYSMLHTKPSRLFYPGRIALIEECYAYTNTEMSDMLLPDLRFWMIVITSVIVAYIVVSYSVWYGITDEINSILNSIADEIRRGPIV